MVVYDPKITYNPSVFGILDVFEPVHTYLEICNDYKLPLPIEYYENLFLCFPSDICELFDWNFQSFYDFIITKGDNYESKH